MAIEIKIPLINPNETDVLIADLIASNGQLLREGDPVALLETTKATHELTAPGEGYVVHLLASAGDVLLVGDLLCYLAEEPGWLPEIKQPDPDSQEQASTKEPMSAGVVNARLTQPAHAYAGEHNLSIEQFIQDTGSQEEMLITREQLEAWYKKQSKAEERIVSFAPLPSSISTPFDPTKIVVYGGGGHGKAVIELIQAIGGYQVVGILDDGIPAGKHILNIPVLGGGEMLEGLYGQGIRLAANAVGGIGAIQVRIKVFERIAKAGFGFPALVHPAAFIERSAVLGAGAQVFPLAYVGSEAVTAFGVIVNTGAIVSHECHIEDYANLSPGAILAGDVHVGKGCLIGMGVTVNLGVRVGAFARIGNSAVIKGDVPPHHIVRAGTVYPSDNIG